MRCAAAALLAGVLVAARSAAAPLTLDDALARARAQQPTLRVAAAELEAARGRLLQAGLIPANPVLSAGAARHTLPPEVNVDRGVLLEQEVEVGGQGSLRVAAARHDVARAEKGVSDRWRTVAGEVRRAFAGLVAAERRRALAVESAGLAARLADVNRRRARAGDVGDIEAQLAQIETTRAAQAVTAAESERTRAAARLGMAIGAGPDETIDVAVEPEAGESAALPTPLPEETLATRALTTRPDLAAARDERARLEGEAQLVHRRGLVPNPTFRGFYRHENADEQIVGGEVSVPLPVWNREQGTEIALQEAARGAAAEVDRLSREIPREVHLALTRRAAAVEAWERYQREAVPAANAARALIERAYVSGYLGLPEVLVQQDRLLQVRASAISAWLDVREAEADLIEAVGEEH